MSTVADPLQDGWKAEARNKAAELQVLGTEPIVDVEKLALVVFGCEDPTRAFVRHQAHKQVVV